LPFEHLKPADRRTKCKVNRRKADRRTWFDRHAMSAAPAQATTEP
jgi:hypothetical protein